MALRYTFLLVTVCVFVKFLTQMNQLSSQMWGYQQKWILNLLGFLVLFDGPLYAAKVYTVDYDINLQDHDTPEDHGRTEASDAVTDQVSAAAAAAAAAGESLSGEASSLSLFKASAAAPPCLSL